MINIYSSLFLILQGLHMLLPTKKSQHLRIAVFGDITGVAGRETVKEAFVIAKEKWDADLIIANGENASHGFGITPKHIKELHSYGLDLMTLGNHTWDKHVLRHKINSFPFVARPINMPKEAPGSGVATIETKFGTFAIINALGRLFMNPSDCPYHLIYDKIKELKQKHNIKMIAIDLHAEATAEKLIMGRFLDGKVSIVWGTHTHVQTADEVILPKGTGYLTDLGMTGAENSIIGFEINAALKKTIYGEPFRNQVENKGPRITTGLIADIDPVTGKTVFITRFKERFEAIEDLIEDPNKTSNYTSEEQDDK
ncbi:MAG: YmdB family metallophosphoesterase [Spirochaetota bacterium]|nr:YmdB family metallophosphoesterase [Spirochaetota bacterium]